MKRILFLFVSIVYLISCADKDIPDKYEDLDISVYDADTEKAISGVSLMLTRTEDNRNFLGVTDLSGEYRFSELKSGEYSIKIEKEDYESRNESISVVINRKNNYPYSLKGVPASLNLAPTILSTTLDFGENSNTEQFRFRNDHETEISWRIFHSCNWIKSVLSHSNQLDSGTLAPGKTETVTVLIDRTKFPQAGSNEDNISVGTSEQGGAKVTIKAVNKYETPITVTNEISDITTTNATLKGAITYNGKPVYTERGFVYSTITNPTLENCLGRQTVAADIHEPHFSSVIPVTANKTYYVKTYAINSKGVAYGNEMTFISGMELATLNTSHATNITTTSATLGGTIITPGSPAYTEKGVCYSTTPLPAVENSHKVIISRDNTAGFSNHVIGLISGTKYYVRAYAMTGNSGVAYGNEISFITHAPVEVTTQSVSNSNVTTTTAKVYGTIVKEGVPVYHEKGICYGFENNPTIETAFPVPVSGSANVYVANLSGLNAYTTYYARAYAKNELGIVYGNTVQFKTKNEKANVSTQTPTKLSGNSVRLYGTILNAGNPSYIEKGFVCSTSQFPTLSDTKIIVRGQESGTFSSTFNYGNNYIYSYHVRAYVINADRSVNYGEDCLFLFDVDF